VVASLEDNKMEHFYKVMMAVKKRPGMFISPINLDGLGNFICGYNCSSLFKQESNNALDDMALSFYDWIAMKEGVSNSPSMNWVEAIMSNISTDEEGLNQFFLHLDSYMNKSENVIEEYKLNSVFIEKYIGLAFVDKNIEPVKAQIVSYDSSKEGVFIKFFNKEGKQINDERYCLSIKGAKDFLKQLGCNSP